MKVLEFMNMYSDWEKRLQGAPYFIKVSKDEYTGYVLLKYNQLSSDFSNQIVRECRGSIFAKDAAGKWICICRAFDKFFNHGEDNAAKVDWTSVTVEEKVDGSLIKFFFYDGYWHFATNGTSNAANAAVGDSGITFYDLIIEALGGYTQAMMFVSYLNPDYTYMFELVSPKSQVTIPYPETKLYYLGQRNMRTMEEKKDYSENMKNAGVLCPKTYPLQTLEECLAYVKTMTRNEEGFVIKDKHFNRVKLKSPEYLIAFHCNNNGVITNKRVINMMKAEQIDDFLAYAPQWKEFVHDVERRIWTLADLWEEDAAELIKTQKREKKALGYSVAGMGVEKAFIFKKYDNPSIIAIDFIMALPTEKINKLIKEIE